MRSFEERFAAVGRALDGAVERVRDRRPRRYERRVGPTLGEQFRERVTRTREFLRDGQWKRAVWVDQRSRRRLIALGSVLGVCLLVAAPWWIVRAAGARPNLQELMDQAMVKARMEMAARQGNEGSVQGSWGAGPGAGARVEQGMNRWGP